MTVATAARVTASMTAKSTATYEIAGLRYP
jgi:hypothetical protein